MASYIKKGESILIPFRNGMSISDSQLKPRIYKTMQAFERSFPSHYLGKNGVELVEYAEVVRCKDCRFYEKETVSCSFVTADANWYEEDFCSYGERRADDLQRKTN